MHRGLVIGIINVIGPSNDGGSMTSGFIITEVDDFIITEGGDFLIIE